MSAPVHSDARRRHPSALGGGVVRFAHPSERLFASWLTRFGHEWRYEPLEFPLVWSDEGRVTSAFRPDFYLPNHRLFVEVTVLAQRLVTKKNRKIRRFRALYPEVNLMVVYRRDVEALRVVYGDLAVEGLAA